MCEAVILAGGYSNRLGMNKMGLMINNKPILHYVINAFIPHCSIIHVVTGHYRQEITELITGYEKVKLHFNENYELGMFSSILCGIKECEEDCFITPGDYPMVDASIVLALKECKGDFIVPTYEKKGGHPVLIRKELMKELKKESMDSNLKVFRNRHKITYLPLNSPGILEDVDTMEAYLNVKQLMEAKI